MNPGNLSHDTSNQTSGDGTATFTNVEALALLDGQWLVDLADHLDVVARHNHLAVGIFGTLWPVERGGLVYATLTS